MTASLFEPVQLGDILLANRVVMAPMTRSRAGPGDVPTELNVEYYRQRASAGLLISEATCIAPEGIGATTEYANSTEDPLYCGIAVRTLRVDSYGNPNNNDSGKLIGKFPVACMGDTLLRNSTFSGGSSGFVRFGLMALVVMGSSLAEAVVVPCSKRAAPAEAAARRFQMSSGQVNETACLTPTALRPGFGA